MASHLYEIKVFIVDWRDDSGAESIDCSSRGLKFRSQHPHVDSEPSLTLSLGHPVLSSDLCENQAHMWSTCINAGKAPIHRKQNKSSKKSLLLFLSCQRQHVLACTQTRGEGGELLAMKKSLLAAGLSCY